MAILYPTLGEIKGKIGGITFQVNPAGNVMRGTPRPRKTSTRKQQEVHQTHQHWIHQWQALTLGQQTLWNDYAALYLKVNKFGIERQLTGFNWYESVNTQLDFAGQSLLTVPASHTVPNNAPAFTVYSTETALMLQLDAAFDFTNHCLLVFGTPPTAKASQSVNRIVRRMGVLATATPAVYNITSIWEEATGMDWSPSTSFPDGNIHICLQALRKSSGITSPYLCGSVNVSDNGNWDSDMLAYIAEWDTPPQPAIQIYLNNFFKGIKADGDFTTIVRAFLFCNVVQQQGLVSMRYPSSDQAVPTNSPTWTSLVGYQGNVAGSYVNLKYDGTADTPTLSQNSYGMGLWVKVAVATTTAAIGAANHAANTRHHLLPLYSATITEFATGAGSVSWNTSDGLGFLFGKQTAASAQSIWQNATSKATGTVATGAISPLDFYAMVYNNNGTPSTTYQGTISFAIISTGSLNPVTFYPRLLTLLQNMGVA